MNGLYTFSVHRNLRASYSDLITKTKKEGFIR
nr:MAG TPA: hypothetical protein [Caudoviricetes sp.]